MRLLGHTLLLVLAMRAYQFGHHQHQQVQDWVRLNTELAAAPALAQVVAAARLCQPHTDSSRPCRWQLQYRGGDVCELSEEQLERKRRLAFSLKCQFVWLPGVVQRTSLTAVTYRLAEP